MEPGDYVTALDDLLKEMEVKLKLARKNHSSTRPIEFVIGYLKKEKEKYANRSNTGSK
jgi:hypothetical protein